MTAGVVPPQSQAPRRIAHLDMDAFYASVELLRYPELKGQPVAIGGRRAQQPELLPDGNRCFARLKDYVGRGVLTTATYEARALGIHSGLGTMKAAKLAPDAILLPVDFDAYRHYSRLFKAAVATIAPMIEDRGIDEIYIDLTDVAGGSLDLAQRIKQTVLKATGLTCSIGITPNKLLSKICSDLQKPDGITILGFDDLPTRIWPLSVRKINGIGPKATEKLAGLGITTIADLARQERTFLMEHFGRSYGAWLYDAARGIDERPIVTESDPKSVSRETTFERDLHPRQDRQQLGEVFTSLCQRVAGDLQRKGVVGRTVGIKLRYEDFHTVTRDKRLRLLGVRLSALTPIDDWKAEHPPSPQADLFLETVSAP
jgi:DNA polymerase-4